MVRMAPHLCFRRDLDFAQLTLGHCQWVLSIENTEIFYKKLIKNKWKKEKEYTLKDVKKINWMVLFGNVYDVSKWIKIHPGGDVIKYGLGKDATDIFKNVGHR